MITGTRVVLKLGSQNSIKSVHWNFILQLWFLLCYLLKQYLKESNLCLFYYLKRKKGKTSFVRRRNVQRRKFPVFTSFLNLSHRLRYYVLYLYVSIKKISCISSFISFVFPKCVVHHFFMDVYRSRFLFLTWCDYA